MTGSNIPAALLLAESLGADAVGINCSLGPEQMESFVDEMLTLTFHCHQPERRSAGFCERRDLVPRGAGGILRVHGALCGERRGGCCGGCCGTTPEHIRLLAERLKNKPVKERHIEKKTVVSSYTHTVTFGARTDLIGERIVSTAS